MLCGRSAGKSFAFSFFASLLISKGEANGNELLETPL